MIVYRAIRQEAESMHTPFSIFKFSRFYFELGILKDFPAV